MIAEKESRTVNRYCLQRFSILNLMEVSYWRGSLQTISLLLYLTLSKHCWEGCSISTLGGTAIAQIDNRAAICRRIMDYHRDRGYSSSNKLA